MNEYLHPIPNQENGEGKKLFELLNSALKEPIEKGKFDQAKKNLALFNKEYEHIQGVGEFVTNKLGEIEELEKEKIKQDRKMSEESKEKVETGTQDVELTKNENGSWKLKWGSEIGEGGEAKKELNAPETAGGAGEAVSGEGRETHGEATELNKIPLETGEEQGDNELQEIVLETGGEQRDEEAKESTALNLEVVAGMNLKDLAKEIKENDDTIKWFEEKGESAFALTKEESEEKERLVKKAEELYEEKLLMELKSGRSINELKQENKDNEEVLQIIETIENRLKFMDPEEVKKHFGEELEAMIDIDKLGMKANLSEDEQQEFKKKAEQIERMINILGIEEYNLKNYYKAMKIVRSAEEWAKIEEYNKNVGKKAEKSELKEGEEEKSGKFKNVMNKIKAGGKAAGKWGVDASGGMAKAAVAFKVAGAVTVLAGGSVGWAGVGLTFGLAGGGLTLWKYIEEGLRENGIKRGARKKNLEKNDPQVIEKLKSNMACLISMEQAEKLDSEGNVKKKRIRETIHKFAMDKKMTKEQEEEFLKNIGHEQKEQKGKFKAELQFIGTALSETFSDSFSEKNENQKREKIEKTKDGAIGLKAIEITGLRREAEAMKVLYGMIERNPELKVKFEKKGKLVQAGEGIKKLGIEYTKEMGGFAAYELIPLFKVGALGGAFKKGMELPDLLAEATGSREWYEQHKKLKWLAKAGCGAATFAAFAALMAPKTAEGGVGGMGKGWLEGIKEDAGILGSLGKGKIGEAGGKIFEGFKSRHGIKESKSAEQLRAEQEIDNKFWEKIDDIEGQRLSQDGKDLGFMKELSKQIKEIDGKSEGDFSTKDKIGFLKNQESIFEKVKGEIDGKLKKLENEFDTQWRDKDFGKFTQEEVNNGAVSCLLKKVDMIDGKKGSSVKDMQEYLGDESLRNKFIEEVKQEIKFSTAMEEYIKLKDQYGEGTPKHNKLFEKINELDGDPNDFSKEDLLEFSKKKDKIITEVENEGKVSPKSKVESPKLEEPVQGGEAGQTFKADEKVETVKKTGEQLKPMEVKNIKVEKGDTVWEIAKEMEKDLGVQRPKALNELKGEELAKWQKAQDTYFNDAIKDEIAKQMKVKNLNPDLIKKGQEISIDIAEVKSELARRGIVEKAGKLTPKDVNNILENNARNAEAAKIKKAGKSATVPRADAETAAEREVKVVNLGEQLKNAGMRKLNNEQMKVLAEVINENGIEAEEVANAVNKEGKIFEIFKNKNIRNKKIVLREMLKESFQELKKSGDNLVLQRDIIRDVKERGEITKRETEFKPTIEQPFDYSKGKYRVPENLEQVDTFIEDGVYKIKTASTPYKRGGLVLWEGEKTTEKNALKFAKNIDTKLTEIGEFSKQKTWPKKLTEGQVVEILARNPEELKMPSVKGKITEEIKNWDSKIRGRWDLISEAKPEQIDIMRYLVKNSNEPERIVNVLEFTKQIEGEAKDWAKVATKKNSGPLEKNIIQKWLGLKGEQVNDIEVKCNGKTLTIKNVHLGKTPVDIVLKHGEPAMIGSTYYSFGKNHYTEAKGVTPNVLEQVKDFLSSKNKK